MPEAGRLWAFKVWLRRSNLDPPTLAQMHPVILHISIIIKSRKCSTISCFWHHHYHHYDFQCKALLSFPKCLESCIFTEVNWSQSQLVSMWYVLNHCIGKQFWEKQSQCFENSSLIFIWDLKGWPLTNQYCKLKQANNRKDPSKYARPAFLFLNKSIPQII